MTATKPLTQKPFAALADKSKNQNLPLPPPLPVMTKQAGAPKKPIKKEFKKIFPEYCRKLMNESGLSTKEIASLIGCSYGTLNEASRVDKVSKPIEVAAKGIWKEKFEQHAPVSKDGLVFVSMLISREAIDSLKGWLDQAGATVKIFK